MDARKAYGVITALGKRLGEAARADPAVLARLRAVIDAEGLAALVRDVGGLPPATIEDFLAYARSQDVGKVRAQLVLQAKMTLENKRPAPGHETGRGTVSGKK